MNDIKIHFHTVSPWTRIIIRIFKSGSIRSRTEDLTDLHRKTFDIFIDVIQMNFLFVFTL